MTEDAAKVVRSDHIMNYGNRSTGSFTGGIETSEPRMTGAGNELEASPSATAPSAPVRATNLPLDEPSGVFADAPVASAAPPEVVAAATTGLHTGDSSAVHLAGNGRGRDRRGGYEVPKAVGDGAGEPARRRSEIVRKAWEFCMLQHEGQKRASGEPYIIHPLEVAQVLAELKMDSTAIAAGLLHDAVEDTDVTSAEIAKMFGEQVAHIVEGVTKLDKIKFANREDHQGGEHPQDAAGHGDGCACGHHQAGPTGCTTCVRSNT